MEDPSFVKLLITEDVYLLPIDAPHYQTGDNFDDHTITSAEEPTEEASTSDANKPESIATGGAVPTADTSAAPENASGEIASAVITPEQKPTFTPPVFEGNNLKEVLVVVHAAGLDFAHKDLLMKILGAISLAKEDVAILPSGHITSKADFDWMAKGPKKSLVAFGLPDKWKAQIVPDHSLYQVRTHHGYQLLFSDKLEDIASNVEAKKKLWAALQNL